MTHYNREQWIAYKNKILAQEEVIKMEDHIYTCDTCMDIFLSLIDSEDLGLAEKIIPPDFTATIMDQVGKVTLLSESIDKPIKKYTKKKKMIENIFMYYVAVASVVLVLTAGGVFTKLTEIPIENIGENTFKTEEDIGGIYSLTERIIDGTNNFINNFGTEKKEGGN